MCMICNLGEHDDIAQQYLAAQAKARVALAESARLMFLASKKATNPEAAAHYASSHQRLRAVVREYQAIEEQREVNQSCNQAPLGL
jgi:hypothetical protein